MSLKRLSFVFLTLLFTLFLGIPSQASQSPTISRHGIAFSTGNKFISQRDVSLTGPVSSLSFSRHYNSQSTENNTLGYGWSNTHDEHLRYIESHNLIILTRADGRMIHFYHNGVDAWTNKTKKVTTITELEEGGFQLTTPSNTIKRYNVDGQLIEKHERNNNSTFFAYSDGVLTSIGDAFGRNITLNYDDNNRLQSLTTAIGNISYSYDDNENLTSVIQADGSSKMYLYEDPNDVHNLTGIIDESGTRTLTVGYDSKDRVTSSAFSDGAEAVTIVYQAGYKRVVTDSLGVSSTYQLEVMHGVVKVSSYTGPGCASCGSDSGTSYIYNSRQQVISSTDALGNVTTYQYDTKGNRTQVTKGTDTSLEHTTSYTYHPDTNLVASTSQSSIANPGEMSTSSMVYDTSGNLLSRTESGFVGTEAISRSTSYTYDTYGRVSSINGPRIDVNDITTLTYYPNTLEEGLNRGFLHTVSNSLNQTTTYSNYTVFGKAATITNPTSTTTMTFDTMGRVLTRTSNDKITSSTYDITGKLKRIDMPDGRFVTYTYNTGGQTVRVEDSMGNALTYAYDSKAQKSKEEVRDQADEIKRFISYEYDESGHLKKTIQPDASYEEQNYDEVGNLVSQINSMGQQTDYGYDALGRLTTVTSPGEVNTSYSYDSQNNLISVTDGEGRQTIFTYDDLGRKTNRTSPDSGLTSYQYDQAGNLISSTNANDVTTSYEYDVLNRLVAIHYPDTSQDVTYAYDENGYTGLLTSIQDSTGSTNYDYDAFGRVVLETRIQGTLIFSIAYGYNDNSELTSITYPSGREITYVRNTVGQVVSVTSTYDGVSTILSNDISYLPYGPVTSTALGNGQNISNNYDQLYRLTNSTAGIFFNRDYSYYANSSVHLITDNIDSSASQSFTYDDLNRLTNAQGKYGSYSWSYDNVGNRLTQQLNTETTSYTYETGTNKLVRTNNTEATDYYYDTAGNLTDRGNTELNWDQNNRLISASMNAETVGEYGYDSRNLRTMRTTGGQLTHTLYDQSGNILAELNEHGEVLREFAYLNGIKISLFDYTINPEFYVDVAISDGSPLQDTTVYAFNEQNNYTGISSVTDSAGMATFQRADFGEGSYTFRVDYLGGQFLSTAEEVRAVKRTEIIIPVEQVDLSVIMAGAPIADVSVYVYTADGQYLGIYATTDAEGNVSFTLAEGVEYLFKTEILGNEYWSSAITVIDGGESVSIDTGGGTFSFSVGESTDIPLAAIQTYLFNETGTYLGLSSVTNSQGEVFYTVPEGSYQFRVDYLGYQFWSESFYISQNSTGSLLIPHKDLEIFVGSINSRNVTKPLADVTLSLYTTTGTELDQTVTSDNKGRAVFHVPEKEYKVQAMYLASPYWSDAFIWNDAEIIIETGSAVATVTTLGEILRDVPVTVMSSSGIDLVTDTSNGKGEVEFLLAAGTYLFRADYQGHQYFSPETEVFIFQESQAEIEVGGGNFVLSLQTENGTPLNRVETSVYTADGLSINESAKTDNRGCVSYDLAYGTYKVRINYMGYDYWTNVVSIPDTTELEYVIEHREVTAGAILDYLGDQRSLKNVKVQLWTADGTYLKISEKIGKDYLAHFSLPEQQYVFKVVYMDQLFPSEPLTWSDTVVVIDEGIAEVTLTNYGEAIPRTPVSVFSVNGVDLGLTSDTDRDGMVNFRLPEGTYEFWAEYNEAQYQATEYVTAHQVTPLSLDISGETINLTLKSSSSAVLTGIPCSLYDVSGNNLERSAISDNQGMVSFTVAPGDYVVAADYFGTQFQSDVFSVPGTLSDTLLIEHQQVGVTLSGDDGVSNEPLAGVRCSLFTESGVATGIITTTDTNGVAYFNVPLDSYRVHVDYLGQEYWTDTFDWFDTDLSIALGSLSLHLTDLGAEVADASVYLFTEAGEYLGLTTITDLNGEAVFRVPEGAYRVRVNYNNTQYWSDVVHVLAYQDNPVELALDLLALDLTNNPHPERFDGKPPVYMPMIASIGSLSGLLASQNTGIVVNNDPQTFYYISDHLSTAQLLVNELGEVVWQGNYSPFGEVDVVVNEIDNNFRFPGQYFDAETGLYYNWHRFYDPATGRYISADPIGLQGGINLYAYVSNDPVNMVDPWGLSQTPGCDFTRINKSPINGIDIGNQYGRDINYRIEFTKLTQEVDGIAATICKGEKEKYTLCVDRSGNYSIHKGYGAIYMPDTQCGSTYIEGTKDCQKCTPSH